MDRETAWNLLQKYTHKEGLLQHARAVEAAMRAYARRFGEDEEAWAVVGLLHDFDYEIHPTMEEHPAKGAAILEEHGVPSGWIRAILAHGEHTGVPRDTRMARALFAVDELSGFLVACALVRPGRTLEGLTPKSVKKKLKDRRFAAAVNRDDIHRGAEELGIELAEHIGFVTDALRGAEEALGLGV